MSGVFLKVLLVAVALGCLPWAIEVALRREFVVHREGVVVVSGASTGIGRDAALRLAELGYTVFAGGRSEKDAEGLRQAAPGSSHLVPTVFDVTKAEQLEALVVAVEKRLRETGLPLAAVVNNAGISMRAPLESSRLDQIRRLFDVNLFGALDLTQRFIPLLREFQGRVLFVSSVAAMVTTPGSGAYSASKRALEGVVDALRLELGFFGVAVVSIQPGFIATSISGKELEAIADLPAFVGEEQHRLYRGWWANDNAKMDRLRAHSQSTAVTTAAILHALSSPYPLTRYPVGPADGLFSAKVISAFTGFLPDRLTDLLKFVSNKE